jgi:hypothetical protein
MKLRQIFSYFVWMSSRVLVHGHVPEAFQMLVQSSQSFVLTATYHFNYFWKRLQGNYGSIGNAGYFTIKSADLILVGEIVSIVKHNAKISRGLQKKCFQLHVSNTTAK